MCTEIVSCLTRCKIVKEDEFEEPEDGELVENDQNSLFLELSTDLDEEQGESSEHKRTQKCLRRKNQQLSATRQRKTKKENE